MTDATHSFAVRAHIGQVQPEFGLPRRVGGDLILRQWSDGATGNVARFRDYDGHIVLDALGSDAHDRIHGFLSALRVGSECSAYVKMWECADGRVLEGEQKDAYSWAHMSPALTEAHLGFIETHLDVIGKYLLPETYSRTGNALRLFEAALPIERSSGLALLGFVGAIESLFSVAKQELSFRLSLSLAKFLATGNANQRFIFDRARELYVVRSKIAHGDKIDASEETAAIVLAQYWTPQAAQLARASLRAVFDRGLTEVFDSRKEHEKLMDALPFSEGLDQALDPKFRNAAPTIGRGLADWLD